MAPNIVTLMDTAPKAVRDFELRIMTLQPASLGGRSPASYAQTSFGHLRQLPQSLEAIDSDQSQSADKHVVSANGNLQIKLSLQGLSVSCIKTRTH